MTLKENFTGAKLQRNVLIIAILLILGGVIYYQTKYSDMERDLAISRQNEYALAGRIVEGTTKNEKLEFSKGVLVTKNKDLESLSSTLKDEYDNEKGKVHRLQRIIATMGNQNADGTIDTLEVQNTVHHYADGSYGLKWGDTTYHDSLNFRQLAGVSDFKLIKADSGGYGIKPLTTKITDDKIGFNIITGLKTSDETGMVEIFVRSDYPNFQVTQLEGAIIDPESDPIMKKFTRQKKFTVSGFVGYGVFGGNGTFGYGPMVGIGLGRTLFSF